ncbi:MAG: hypothetical protein KVP17_005219 [Porospora cf. gigantea B]|uniref:uncharacterized protein n=1 Tax=Porospora cf. gigantea B TaxID=2853592 RepID=UPI0035718144|nr:MAG: hypothetical protein KVP17_005219 [Porospora cf. gigantea B]
MSHTSLVELIDKSSLECLNQSSDCGASDVLLQPSPDVFVESDVDDQLLVSFGFRQPVRVYALRIVCPEEAVKGGFSPESVKVFANTMNLDFQSAEESHPTQELELAADQLLEGTQIPLRFAKFQHVTHMTLFFESSTGADVLRIGHIEAIGKPCDAMNMGDWKPSQEGEA